MNVLITGGAGFIGSELTSQSVARGDRVTVVDNLVNGKRENLSGLLGDQCVLAVEDIRRTEEIESLFEDVDVVFHLACLGVRHSIHSPRENHDVNATATLDLLALARRRGVRRFVYVSSSEIYGTARWSPMTEDYPPSPMTVYGAAKLAGECYARAYHRTYGFPTVIIRPFNAYGPRSHHEGDSGEVIPKFVLRSLAGKEVVIFGDGTQTRDFTEVGDTARAILRAGEAPGIEGETINVGSGQEISMNELAELVGEVVGNGQARPPLYTAPRPGDVLRLCADVAKARRLLDFEPHIALREGLARLCAWYREQPQSAAELLREEVMQNWVSQS
jgi:UDP-glucose 4-epimerase